MKNETKMNFYIKTFPSVMLADNMKTVFQVLYMI